MYLNLLLEVTISTFFKAKGKKSSMLFFLKKKWEETKNWLRGVVSEPVQTHFYQDAEGQQPICRVLCVDDDKSFCLFMQQLAHSFGIQVDIAYSIKEAKEVIEANSEFKAFIIDGHLPDGSGFELIAWIREKKELTIPIIFISRIYQDATSFRVLKESLQVDFVLEKPIQSNQIHQLFVQLCKLISLQTKLSDFFSDTLLLDLKMNYQKTIPDKIERLEKLILNAQRDLNIEHLQILKSEVHKIAGSAGSYGYGVISELCKNLEIDLDNQIDLFKRGQFNQIWLESLDAFFTQVKLHFQMKIPEFEFQSSLKTGFLTTIYMVDGNKQVLDEFTQSTQHLEVEALTELHPDQAISTLLAADFYPEILLFNAHYSSTSLTGYELIKAFYQNNDELTSVIALMVEEQSLESQIEALQKGMSVIIAKPFLSSLLIPLLEQIPFRPFPLKFNVCVIDDDSDICGYILNTLKFTGLEVKTIQNISDLENIIKQNQLDLILLDIHLTDPTGVGILHRLRNDWGYQNLLMGMITLKQQDTHLIQQCYDANINDLLFKPLERGVLQRKISLLLKSETEKRLLGKTEIQWNWIDGQTFERYLKQLKDQHQVLFPKLLCVFEIEGLFDVSMEIKRIINEYMNVSLENLFRKYEVAARLESDRFAIIFHGYDPNFVQLFMRDFLQQMYTYLQKHLLTKPIYIHAVFLLLSRGVDIDSIWQRTEELFCQVKQQEKKPVSLIMDPTYGASKEIYIFDDEKQSIEFFESLFKEQGFKLQVFEDIDKIPHFGSKLPLFILRGSFAEAKGLHLLKKLMYQHQIQIPLLHLPHLPDREFLMTILNKVHYFDSPFALAIFILRKNC